MIERASRFFPVATVQNRFNLVDRKSEDVLDYCTERNIGFMPWAPLAAGSLARSGTVLDTIAKEREVSAGQVALAWLLHRSPVMLPIPGTGSPSHLEDNMRAAAISLNADECAALDRQGREVWEKADK